MFFIEIMDIFMGKCKRIIKNHLLQLILKLIHTSNKLTETNIKKVE